MDTMRINRDHMRHDRRHNTDGTIQKTQYRRHSPLQVKIKKGAKTKSKKERPSFCYKGLLRYNGFVTLYRVIRMEQSS
jgi:hypothetical protein